MNEAGVAETGEESLDFFVQKDEYLPTVCAYLQNAKRSGQDWVKCRFRSRNLITTLRCIQVFLKDVQELKRNGETAAEKAYQNHNSDEKFQLGISNQLNSIKQLIKLLHLIFVYEDKQMVSYAEQDGFLPILGLLKLENELVTQIALKYLQKWLQVDEQYNQEDSDDPERIISVSDYASISRSQGYLQGMLGKMRDRLKVNDLLNQDFVQKEGGTIEESKGRSLQDEIDSTNFLKLKSNRKGSIINEAEQQQLIKQGSAATTQNSKGISKEQFQSTTSSDSQVRKLLRQVTGAIKVCHESKLIHYAYVIKVLNVFVDGNFQQIKKCSEVFDAIKQRFRSGETQLLQVFDLFMQILETQGKNNIKNKQFWDLNMQIIESMVQGQKDNDSSEAHQELLIQCISKFKTVTYHYNSKVSSVLLQDGSQERIRILIFQVLAQQQNSTTDLLAHLLDFSMLLLHITRSDNKSHAFAIHISELLTNQRGEQRTIRAEQGRKLFQFLRMIIKDKNSMVSDLISLDQEDQMLDIEYRFDQLIDKQMRRFLKLTFMLYFDFNKDAEWHMESQMLLLCALDLQEKVNLVNKVHSIPQMFSLFKETEEDSEIEGINFLETIQSLLNQREESQLQDILNGFLAAKLTIVFQDTPLLAMEDIKILVNELIQEDDQQDPLDSIMKFLY